jgi:hypothetical protein
VSRSAAHATVPAGFDSRRSRRPCRPVAGGSASPPEQRATTPRTCDRPRRESISTTDWLYHRFCLSFRDTDPRAPRLCGCPPRGDAISHANPPANATVRCAGSSRSPRRSDSSQCTAWSATCLMSAVTC